MNAKVEWFTKIKKLSNKIKKDEQKDAEFKKSINFLSRKFYQENKLEVNYNISCQLKSLNTSKCLNVQPAMETVFSQTLRYNVRKSDKTEKKKKNSYFLQVREMVLSRH